MQLYLGEKQYCASHPWSDWHSTSINYLRLRVMPLYIDEASPSGDYHKRCMRKVQYFARTIHSPLSSLSWGIMLLSMDHA